jgi:hypothetical protein
MTVSFITAKALKDNAAKKRALSSKRNQQVAQVIFLSPLPVNISGSDFYHRECLLYLLD